MTPVEVRQRATLMQGGRVQVHYRTRVLWSEGVAYPVWGGDRHPPHATVAAHARGRLVRVERDHLLLQADSHARPLAIVLGDVLQIARDLLRTVPRATG